MITAPTGSRHSPAASADNPRTFCRYSVVTNKNEPNPHSANNAIRIAELNGTLRKSRNSSIGSVRRGS